MNDITPEQASNYAKDHGTIHNDVGQVADLNTARDMAELIGIGKDVPTLEIDTEIKANDLEGRREKEANEVFEQKKPHSELLVESLKPFDGKLNEKSRAIISADYSKNEDYIIEKTDYDNIPGIIFVSERWKGGERRTRIIDERFTSRDSWDVKPGRVEVHYKNDWLKIDTNIDKDGTLRQETLADVSKASQRRTGEVALMEGKIFNYANTGKIRESVYIEPNGQVSTERYWNEDIWIGHDTYQLRKATQEGDVVKFGQMRHGIGLGYSPEMRTVN